MNKLYLFYSSKQMKNWRFFSGVQVLNSESREPCNCIIRAYLERLGKEPNFWQYFGRITNVMSFKLRIFELESFDLAFPTFSLVLLKKFIERKILVAFPWPWSMQTKSFTVSIAQEKSQTMINWSVFLCD